MIFQWRTLDYIPLTDSFNVLTDRAIDFDDVNWFSVASYDGQVKVQFLSSDRPVAEQTSRVEAGRLRGVFETSRPKPGIYSLRASVDPPQQASRTARRQIILTPDSFE